MMAVHKFIATEVFDDNPDLLEEYSNLVDPHNKSAVVSVAILRKIARLKKIRRGVTFLDMEPGASCDFAMFGTPDDVSDALNKIVGSSLATSIMQDQAEKVAAAGNITRQDGKTVIRSQTGAAARAGAAARVGPQVCRDVVSICGSCDQSGGDLPPS
jgi:hypothetical protein